MKILKGKVALVTGVGRREGIGAAICHELAKNGADVFLTYWHTYDSDNYSETKKEDLNSFIEELRQFGNRIESSEIDLSNPGSPKILFNSVSSELGVPDILINNAVFSSHQPLEEVTADLLDKHYAVNIRATTLLCKEFVIATANGGNIINLTSGQDLGVMKDELPYTITKAGINMLTQQLAPELLEKGITINALDPGPTDTGWMTEDLKEQILKDSKRGKINTPEDTAQLIVDMVLDDSKETGQIIHAER